MLLLVGGGRWASLCKRRNEDRWQPGTLATSRPPFVNRVLVLFVSGCAVLCCPLLAVPSPLSLVFALAK